jgi:ubiquinone/menaquinone biosynthesis C-methylase UbiE
MKEIDGRKYYHIDEIHTKLKGKVKKEQIREHFESKHLQGILIDNIWYGEEDSLENIMFLESAMMIGRLELDLSNIALRGRILDIGGGGEGVIGQFKGEKVVAIDLRASELDEAAEGEYLKVIMDAKDLKFLDQYFDTVTAFFSLMYILPSDREKVFQECYRILKIGGEFVIWDLSIPEKTDKKQDKVYYGIALSINIGKKEISTSYAIHWNRDQNYDLYAKLGQSVGFTVKDHKEDEHTFYIRFVKN